MSQASKTPRRPGWMRDRRVLMALLIGGVAVVLLGYWILSGREKTDNARIEGHVHPVATRVPGTVSKTFVRENDRVSAGDVLFEIDRRDYEVALARAEADLAAAEAAARAAESEVPIGITSAESDLSAANAALAAAVTGVELARQATTVAEERQAGAQAELESIEALATAAGLDVERLQPLVEKDQVSRKRYDDALAALNSGRAQVEAHKAAARGAQQQVAMAEGRLLQAKQHELQARSNLANARTAPQRKELTRAHASAAVAQAEQARARLLRAQLDLEYTQVRAPANGVIARKRVEIGQVVSAGQPLLAVVALDDIWAVANFKETQINDMLPGQPAVIKVDAYGGRKVRGHVDSIGPATGSRFSMLPAENATGNFVKVVQRIPIKIVLDDLALKELDIDRPLRPGMSVIAIVSTRSPGRDQPGR